MVGKRNGTLCGGSYITWLAKNLGVFLGEIALGGLNVKMTDLDVKVMINMGMVKRRGTRYTLVRQAEEKEASQEQSQPQPDQPAKPGLMPAGQQPAQQLDVAGPSGAGQPKAEEEDVKPNIKELSIKECHYNFSSMVNTSWSIRYTRFRRPRLTTRTPQRSISEGEIEGGQPGGLLLQYGLHTEPPTIPAPRDSSTSS